MRKILFAVLILSAAAFGQNAALPAQYCVQGATQAVVSGLNSANYLQGVIPSCTVTVYLTGTTTLATIYSNATGTVQNNPFTASPTGQFLIYAAEGQGYNVVLSGGVSPNVYTSPVSLTGLMAGGSGGGLPTGCTSPGTGDLTCTGAIDALTLQAGPTPTYYVLIESPSTLTASYTQQLQTANGTIALTSQISAAQVAANLASSGATGVSGILPIANGGTGTATPGLVQGTNITVTGSWPNQTITASSTASTAFSALTGSTNTSAAMVVGSGASLAASGTGTIAATSVPVAGVTGLTPSAIGAEPALGNPSTNGYILSSTTGGTRSWIAPSSGSGSVSSYPTCTGSVVPCQYTLTGQGANISATTLYTPSANELHIVSCQTVTTRAAGTGTSQLPNCNVVYTDADTSVSNTLVVGSGTATPMLGTVSTNAAQQVNLKSGTNLQFTTTFYTAGSAPTQLYSVRVIIQ